MQRALLFMERVRNVGIFKKRRLTSVGKCLYAFKKSPKLVKAGAIHVLVSWAETEIHLLIQSWKCDQPVTPSLCQAQRFRIRSLHVTQNSLPTQLFSRLKILLSDSLDRFSLEPASGSCPACLSCSRVHCGELLHIRCLYKCLNQELLS